MQTITTGIIYGPVILRLFALLQFGYDITWRKCISSWGDLWAIFYAEVLRTAIYGHPSDRVFVGVITAKLPKPLASYDDNKLRQSVLDYLKDLRNVSSRHEHGILEPYIMLQGYHLAGCDKCWELIKEEMRQTEELRNTAS